MTYRNRKLLDLARGQACVQCGRQDDTVVAAHSNQNEHGKGMGIKAHDAMHAWLCYTCHAYVDAGKTLSRAERRDFMLKNITKTIMRMWDMGLLEVAKNANNKN